MTRREIFLQKGGGDIQEDFLREKIDLKFERRKCLG
jgi:hypothetical protein